MVWETVKITTDSGDTVEGIAPLIISASRSTDIPAFYSEWFINRLRAGYSIWQNPITKKNIYVSYNNTRLVVFWSKNPKPIIQHLEYLDRHKINYYFQYTLNDYVKEKLEPNVPDLKERIDTFIELSEKIGKSKVIWRFDPLILIEGKISVDGLIEKIENIGARLQKFTEKLVFSYADIGIYRRVQSNLQKEKIRFIEFDETTMIDVANKISKLNQNWNLQIATCAERMNLAEYGINHNKCIDDELIQKLFPSDKILMNFLGVETTGQLELNLSESHSKLSHKQDLKDKGQRKDCGCIVSKDIGRYNTCPHSCLYCYANANRHKAHKYYEEISRNNISEIL